MVWLASMCVSAAEGNSGENAIEAKPAEDEGEDLGRVAVFWLQEEQGQEQGSGEDDPGQKGREKSEQFLEAEKKPGAIDMQKAKGFRFKGGGEQQAEKKESGSQQRMLAEGGPVFSQMLPGKDSPYETEADDMIDIDPLHTVIADGKEEIIQGAAHSGNGGNDIFGNQAGGGAGAVSPQDVAAEEQKQSNWQGGGQPDPLGPAIGVAMFEDGPEMDDGEQEEELAGIEMERTEIVAKRDKHIKRAGGVERGGRVILEGHNHA